MTGLSVLTNCKSVTVDISISVDTDSAVVNNKYDSFQAEVEPYYN